MNEHKAWAKAQKFIFIQSKWCDQQIKNKDTKSNKNKK